MNGVSNKVGWKILGPNYVYKAKKVGFENNLKGGLSVKRGSLRKWVKTSVSAVKFSIKNQPNDTTHDVLYKKEDM